MTARRGHSMTDSDAGVAPLRQTEVPVNITGKPGKIAVCTASSVIASCRSGHKKPVPVPQTHLYALAQSSPPRGGASCKFPITETPYRGFGLSRLSYASRRPKPFMRAECLLSGMNPQKQTSAQIPARSQAADTRTIIRPSNSCHRHARLAQDFEGLAVALYKETNTSDRKLRF